MADSIEGHLSSCTSYQWPLSRWVCTQENAPVTSKQKHPWVISYSWVAITFMWEYLSTDYPTECTNVGGHIRIHVHKFILCFRASAHAYDYWRSFVSILVGWLVGFGCFVMLENPAPSTCYQPWTTEPFPSPGGFVCLFYYFSCICFVFETRSCYVTNVDRELTEILLPPLPKGWDSRRATAPVSSYC